jgi:uncharacterized protein
MDWDDDNDAGADAPPVAIPHGELSPDALRGVVEAFVLREGTDYGQRQFSLDEKVAHVMGQLDRREAQIMFDPGSQSIQIVVRDRASG